MKIGDRVFVRGYIDEIRKDTVIIRNAGGYFGTIPSEVITGELPSAQPDNQVHLCDSCKYTYPECPSGKDDVIYGNGKGNDNICACNKYEPSAQPGVPDTNVGDIISRQAAIDALHMNLMYRMGTDSNKKRLDDWINGVPSVQPERTCVNCGRTANNGGWYADGGTRCPIEEHYALPKDGYCHLWEKRNVTDDDCPERREE